MNTIKSLISSLEQRKTELEYRYDNIGETLEYMEEDEKSSYDSEVIEVKRQIDSLDFEIEEAKRALSCLEELKSRIDYLDDEIDKISPYRGNFRKVEQLRVESNKLEDEYSELYNLTLDRLENI